jgi:hypothetical protein
MNVRCLAVVIPEPLARERGERPDELVEVEGAAHWRRC